MASGLMPLSLYQPPSLIPAATSPYLLTEIVSLLPSGFA
uniref:Uncharacterized protein n=1 Tax=Picea glauca TaxID=3330 RepID=A0A101M374_PICGL|nr:hypothetical protein ABT39_MTgene28 [Picea glauca]QHR89344.1 hypothetical protein Q903MT_gene3365 [Picea sitchensis]